MLFMSQILSSSYFLMCEGFFLWGSEVKKIYLKLDAMLIVYLDVTHTLCFSDCGALMGIGCERQLHINILMPICELTT